MIKASHMIRQELLALDEPAHAPARRAERAARPARIATPQNGRPEAIFDNKPEAQSLRRNTSLSSDEADAS